MAKQKLQSTNNQLLFKKMEHVWDISVIKEYDGYVLVQVDNGDTAVLTKDEYIDLKSKIYKRLYK